MRVARLRIYQFRGVKEGCVVFDDHTALFGPNGSGKTAIAEALSLVLGRERFTRDLTEHDFFGADPLPDSRIRIIATLTGFPGNTPEANSEWFRDGRGVPKWWDPQQRVLSPLRQTEHDQLAVEIGFAARFDHETLSVETIRYFHDDDGIEDPFDSEVIVQVPGRLLSNVGFFLLPTLRTWERAMSFGSQLFRHLVSSVGKLPAEEIREKIEWLRKTGLEQADEMKGITKRINDEFRDLLGHELHLQLRLTSTDAESVLRAVVPHYQFPEGPSLPAGRHGTGLLSLQTITLLLQVGQVKRDLGENLILVVEEPECHLTPGLQARVVARMRALTSQTIVTSHSPTVVSLYPAHQVRYTHISSDGHLSASPLFPTPFDHTTHNSIRRLYRDSRADLVAALMYENVLIPEGRIDFEWFRLLQSVTENQLFGATVGVVPTHDAAMTPTFTSLRQVRGNIAVLADGDFQGDRYVQELLRQEPAPCCIVQWPPNWTIEDVVVWILEGEGEDILTDLQKAVPRDFGSLDELRTLLKTTTKEKGIKGDYLSYEAIAGVVREHIGCRLRAQQLLSTLQAVIAQPTLENPNVLTDARSRPDCPVRVWNPWP